MNNSIDNMQINNLCDLLCDLILKSDDIVGDLNFVRERLHEVSPFKDEPIDFVRWVKTDVVHANDYNPNKVAPPEMRLLRLSIEHDGYTQPVVGWDTGDKYEVVDGFHRTRVAKECKSVRDRVNGFLPIVSVKNVDLKDRVSATIRHNRARGVHGVQPMKDIVLKLIESGWADGEISVELGMDAEEVLRYRQIGGLGEKFKNHDYSMAWE